MRHSTLLRSSFGMAMRVFVICGAHSLSIPPRNFSRHFVLILEMPPSFASNGFRWQFVFHTKSSHFCQDGILFNQLFPIDQDKKITGSRFDQLLLHPATTINLANFTTETAVGTTTIPLNLFTNLCVKRFPKHSFLESTLEIFSNLRSSWNHMKNFFLIMETVQSTQ